MRILLFILLLIPAFGQDTPKPDTPIVIRPADVSAALALPLTNLRAAQAEVKAAEAELRLAKANQQAAEAVQREALGRLVKEQSKLSDEALDGYEYVTAANGGIIQSDGSIVLRKKAAPKAEKPKK